MNSTKTKTCSNCKRILPATEFYLRKKGILYTTCKTCKRDYTTKKAKYWQQVKRDIQSLIERYPELCINCKKNPAQIDHHVSYRRNIIIPLCKRCDYIVHRDKSHLYFPKDEMYDSVQNMVLIAFRVSPKALKKLDKISPELFRSEKLRRMIDSFTMDIPL